MYSCACSFTLSTAAIHTFNWSSYIYYDHLMVYDRTSCLEYIRNDWIRNTMCAMMGILKHKKIPIPRIFYQHPDVLFICCSYLIKGCVCVLFLTKAPTSTLTNLFLNETIDYKSKYSWKDSFRKNHLSFNETLLKVWRLSVMQMM